MSSPVNTSPRPLVLCGPSGSGKSTLMKKLLNEFPDKFGFSVSHTTRAPRPLEEDGVSYHYTTKAAMEAMIAEGEFIEHTTFAGNLYGTSKTAVVAVAEKGLVCILDIDTSGVKSMKLDGSLSPRYVFIKPPSLESLEERLRDRGTETEEDIQKRLSACATEMEYGETEGNFDIIVVNDEIDRAYAELSSFILQDEQVE